MRKLHLALLAGACLIVGALVLARPPRLGPAPTPPFAPTARGSGLPPPEVPAGLVSTRGGTEPEGDFPDQELLLAVYPGAAPVRRTRSERDGRMVWAATFSSGVRFRELAGYYHGLFASLKNQKYQAFASDTGQVVTFSATTAHDHLEVSLQEDPERGVTLIRHLRESPPGPA